MTKNYNTKVLVIDNGTLLSKNGYAGEESPRSVFTTVVGYPKLEFIESDVINHTKDYYIGEEATQNREILKLNFPIELGFIKDWKAMEKIWHYTFFTNLEIDPSEHPILLTEIPLNSRSNREKMAEIFFKKSNPNNQK